MKVWTWPNACWLIVYLLAMTLIVGAMVVARRWAIDSFDSAKARAEWRQWQDRTREMAENPGPVSRRPAVSSEPPTVVLLRDYFAVCLTALLILSSVLFLTFMFMVRGVAGGRGRWINDEVEGENDQRENDQVRMTKSETNSKLKNE